MTEALIEALNMHKGEFFCEEIHADETTKIVSFFHQLEPPIKESALFEIGALKDFYSSIGALRLYFCPESGESAFYIANPTAWDELENDLALWVDMLNVDDPEEGLPAWFGSHKVIGEVPASGNYLLWVTDGEESGAIYIFDHDGFEFTRLASNLETFLANAMDPNPAFFSQMVSHMRFVSGENKQQWWAREIRHHSGKVVRNKD